MNQIITKYHTFNQVESISGDYQVWNIPSIGEGAIPLCQSAGGFQINPDTLTYIQGTAQEADILHRSASLGIRTLAQCIAIGKSKRKGPLTAKKQAIASLALPIFEKYTR